MGMLNHRVHHVQKSRIFHNTKLQVQILQFQSRSHMKQVFCQGLASSNFMDNRSYAAVFAGEVTSRTPMGLDDRKVLGSFPKKVSSLEKMVQACHKP